MTFRFFRHGSGKLLLVLSCTLCELTNSLNFNSRNQENLCKMKSLLNRIVVTDLKSIKTSFVCVDTRVQPSRCEETGVGAVSLQDGGRWRIELCDAFFQVESLYGKSSGEKGVCKPIDPSARHRVADRGMIILHELMHNNFLFRDLVWAPLPIKDGDYCYKPSDITAAAKGGNLRVSMICWDLLTAASSYQYYAQAALTQGVACLNPTKNNGMAWANCKNLFPDW